MSYTIPIVLNRIRESQIAAQTEDEYSDNIVDAYGQRVQSNYDWNTDSNRIQETNPLSEHYAYEEFSDSSIASTGYFYIDMDGYRYLNIQGDMTLTLDSLTVTIEVTNQNDGTAPASCAYVNATLALYGFGSYVADFFAVALPPVCCKYARVKYVPAGGNGDADLTVYTKKFF